MGLCEAFMGFTTGLCKAPGIFTIGIHKASRHFAMGVCSFDKALWVHYRAIKASRGFAVENLQSL